ncbi:MAG: beta-glucosidase [Solirubrobacteraceae bacterium]|nr:beta-glucosidase [Solirubrobacteraceae bacterium]
MAWRSKRPSPVRTAMLAAVVIATASAGPAGAAGLPWMDTHKSANQRAKEFVAALTLEEEVAIMHGIGGETGSGFVGEHTGAVPPITRVAFPGLHTTDGPLGVRQHAPATALPSGPALAATWDPKLARSYGVVLGSEARAFNNDIVFGPMTNMVRLEEAGRNFEGLGEDPYLASRLVVADIDGIQSQHVLADVKHFAANNFEANRETVDETISDRTLHELYLPAFEAAVKQGHVATLMAAYNQVNGAYMAENCPLTEHVLRDEWHFGGFVVSDYDSTHGSVKDVTCGTEIEFPTGQNYNALVGDVQAGRIKKALIDRAVTRIARTMFRFGLFDRAACANVNSCTPIDVPAGARAARTIATAGGVLLKNDNATLPLDPAKVHSVAIVGSAASKVDAGGGSSLVQPALTVTPAAGIAARAQKAGMTVVTDASGTSAGAAAAAAQADVAIVVVGDSLTEAYDRPCLLLSCAGNLDAQPDPDAEVMAAVSANPRTVVLVQSGEPDIFPWLAQVPAVLEGWYSGEEDGAAMAALLFGDANPSGRLPVSFPKQQGDTAVQPGPQYTPSGPIVGVTGAKADYSEGVFTGYRHYDKAGIAPQFAFGYGLSYTTFALSRLSVRRSGSQAKATFTVTNTGARAGSDTPQLYVGAPKHNPLDEPVKQLRGFAKIRLAPGASRKVTLPVDLRAISYWDTGRQAWARQPGCHPVLVGESATDIRLKGPTVGPAGARCIVTIGA